MSTPSYQEQVAELPNGLTLPYQQFGSPNDEPLVLIAGITQQMVAWPAEFCERLAAKGFFVTRFDNRDTSHVAATKGVKTPSFLQIAFRRFDKNQYSLDDLADDTIALIDQLGLGRVHLVGWSMGGMIAQNIASRYADRVRSLTGYATTTWHPFIGVTAIDVVFKMFTVKPSQARTEQGLVDFTLGMHRKIGSPGLTDFDAVADEYRQHYRRGFVTSRNLKQAAGIFKSGYRARLNKSITAPTLVIHGTVDRMLKPSAARILAKSIKGSKLVMIEGLGHDLPKPLWERLIGLISDHAKGA